MQAAADAAGSVPLAETGLGGSTGLTPVSDPAPSSPGAFVMGTNEVNASTGGSDPAAQPSAPLEVAIQGYSKGQLDPTAIFYGSIGGVTRQQQAAALSEIGPLAGMVY